MLFQAHAQIDTWVRRLDSRVRLLAAAALSVELAVSTRWPTLATGLAAAILLTLAARLPVRATLRRLLALNSVVVALAVLLPMSMPGEAFAALGPVTFSREGFVRVGQIALKSNAIVLLVAALVGTIEPERLGHALHRLPVPHKLTHLFLFTVRYAGVLHREHERLAAAMKVRCFRPAMNGHTYRSFGYLVGMLLVRSFDRSERILAAMKCRGFQGHYHMIDSLALAGRDAAFAAASCALFAVLLWMETT